MSSGRLEAFSDAVIAVAITIMVLNLHPPNGSSLHDLRPLVPKLSVYLLSFIFVALYWNNHHHLLQVADRVSGAALGRTHTCSFLALADSSNAVLAWPSPRRHHTRRLLRRRSPRLRNRLVDPHPHADRRPRTWLADRPSHRPGCDEIPLTLGVRHRNRSRTRCPLALDRVLRRRRGGVVHTRSQSGACAHGEFRRQPLIARWKGPHAKRAEVHRPDEPRMSDFSTGWAASTRWMSGTQVTTPARRPIASLTRRQIPFRRSSVAMSRCRISMLACDPSMRC